MTKNDVTELHYICPMSSIKVVKGNIFDSKAQTWVNTVNCVGVMGKGIALEFKRRFPEMFKDYQKRCERSMVKLGRPYVYRVRQPTLDMELPTPRPALAGAMPELIINFPTKDHWRSVARLSDIIAGLEYLLQHYREWGVTSIAVPPLGCGHGQLEWRMVGPTLYRYLSRLEIPVELYVPHDVPENEQTLEFLSGKLSKPQSSEATTSKIKPAWVALARIVERIEKEPYHWPIGRTTFQKIAFFASQLGLPTGLQFRRGSYGPFSQELKPLLVKLVNNGILIEQQLGRMFSVKPGPSYPDAVRGYARQLQQWEDIIERVADLFLRLKTKEAEVAATVYFVGQELSQGGKQPTEVEVLQAVKAWKQKRRPPLEEGEISWIIRRLNLLRWMSLKPSGDLPLPKDELESV